MAISIDQDLCGCTQRALDQTLGGLENQVNTALREQTSLLNKMNEDMMANLPLETILDSLETLSSFNTQLYQEAANFSVNVAMGSSRTITCLQGQITADIGDLLGAIDPFGYLDSVGKYAAKIEGYMRAALRGFDAQLSVHVDICGGNAGEYTAVVDALLGDAHVGTNGRFSVPSFLSGSELPTGYRTAFGSASSSVQSMNRLRDNLVDLPGLGGSNRFGLLEG